MTPRMKSIAAFVIIGLFVFGAVAATAAEAELEQKTAKEAKWDACVAAKGEAACKQAWSEAAFDMDACLKQASQAECEAKRDAKHAK